VEVVDDGTDGLVTAGFVVVVGGLVVVVVGGLVVVVVGGTVVVLDGTVEAVVAKLLDGPDEETGAAALTATVPAINAAGAAINVMGRSTATTRGT
jgi:hypothetical protein